MMLWSSSCLTACERNADIYKEVNLTMAVGREHGCGRTVKHTKEEVDR